MNKGEINEVLLKAFLVKCYWERITLRNAPPELRQIRHLSFGPGITMPAWNPFFDEMLENKDYEKLKSIFCKAKTSFKADLQINGVNYSVKCNLGAKAALVNHTARRGFLSVCQKINVPIEKLDEMIKAYWELRTNNTIGEDISNSSQNSPFSEHKDYFKPILEFFLFKGTGSKDSEFPADKILVFGDPFDSSTYKIHELDDAVDALWNKLVFSMRSKKGMPVDKIKVGEEFVDRDGYQPNGKHSDYAPWVVYVGNDNFPKGALHIRS
jgi:hypothetical protein